MNASIPRAGAAMLALALLGTAARAETDRAAGPAGDAATVAAPDGEAASTGVAAASDGADWNRRTRRPQPGSIDYRVRLLAAELKLDAGQQDKVRHILEEQRAQTLKLWNDSSLPSAVRVKATQSVGAQTAEHIRAILTDAQRELYQKPVPVQARAATTTTPEVDRYIQATQRK